LSFEAKKKVLYFLFREMPLNIRDATLLGFGCLFTGAATFFYKRKQTTPFKVRLPPRPRRGPKRRLGARPRGGHFGAEFFFVSL
jgi:hypothetical protein